jgi:hypothetical protein
VFSVVLTVAAAVAGQEGPSITVQDPAAAPLSGEGAIAVGPFLFSPAVQLSWQLRDNIFFEPGEPVSDQVVQAGARLRFEMPLNESVIHFSYTPQYTDYLSYELEDKWSHAFEAGGRFVFANGLVLDATYNHIIGNLQTREVDPGGELVYGDPSFRKNFFGLEGQYWFTNRDGVFVVAEWTDLDHSDPRLFYDYTRAAGGFGWVHQVSANLTMDARYRVIDFDAHDVPGGSNSFRDSLANELTVAVNGQLSPVVATELRAGYVAAEYDRRPGGPPVEDFSGFILSGFLSWELAHGSALRLDLLRSPFPSNFADNANYVATGGSLQYTIDRGSIFGSASGRFQTNDYDLPDPATGLRRSDDITSFGLGLGVRLTDYCSLWGTYVYEDRESLYRFSYSVNIVTLGLLLGF